MRVRPRYLTAGLACGTLALGLLLGACGGDPAETAGQPAQGESNPPGDIPDDTAFVPYLSKAGGFEIKVPEGWARRVESSGVVFTDKLNRVDAHWGKAPASTQAEINSLEGSVSAFHLDQTSDVTLPGGSATLIRYQADSKPSSVTGQTYRLAVQRFDFVMGPREVALTLSSPAGADNVDPWRIISESFGWK